MHTVLQSYSNDTVSQQYNTRVLQYIKTKWQKPSMQPGLGEDLAHTQRISVYLGNRARWAIGEAEAVLISRMGWNISDGAKQTRDRAEAAVQTRAFVGA